MKQIFKIAPFILIIVFFLFLRLYHLEESLTVGTDQGMHLLEMYRLYTQKKISLIGPVSSFKIDGRQFFFGPATYYLPMPFFAASGWNIFSVSYFMIFSQLLALLVLYRVLKTNYPRSNLAIFFLLIFTFSKISVDYSRFLWNPNLMIQTSLLLLSVLISLKNISHQRLKLFVGGLLFGLGMQFHYAFFPIIFICFIWLLFTKRLTLINILTAFLGFIVGFSPLILFELRHNFYNFRTFLAFIIASLKGGNEASLYTPGYILQYYTLPYLPFIYLLVSFLLVKLEKIHKVLVYLLITGYIIYCLVIILPVPSNGFHSAEGWNYHGLQKAKEIIISENRKDYNLVDLLTGDIRAIYLRALLTLSQKPHMTVDEYPDSKYLFIYSKVPIEELLKGSLWEMDVMKPLNLEEKWFLQNDIYLYLLKRMPKKAKI